jgi:DNA end-binding protein Ku
VALYAATLTTKRMAFHTINRTTGHRVRRQFIDSETRKPVAKGDQVKGYEIGQGEYVALEPDEVAAALPESDKTLSISTFIRCSDVDDVYFDRPYYLVPAERYAEETYALIREGMRERQVTALAQTVLFRRVRTVLIRDYGPGLIAMTLNFDYEVRSAKEAFDAIPEMKIKGEMLELAEHIIKTKKGKFDPSKYEDRYEAALADLVKAKIEGKKIEAREPKPERVVDLMAALRESAGMSKKRAPARPPASSTAQSKAKTEPARRKAS